MKVLPLALALCIPALALSAQATGLRCNHDLVEVGDSAAQLLLTCGEPLMRTRSRPRTPRRPKASSSSGPTASAPGPSSRSSRSRAARSR